jgi:hypothetical protein
MEWLLSVAGLAAGMVVLFVRDRAADKRRQRLAAGDDVTCRALLGEATGRLRRGRLHLTADTLVWSGGGRHISLAGARILAISNETLRQARPDDAVVRLRRPDGQDARLVLHEADAALLVKRLRDTGAPTGDPTLAAPVGVTPPEPSRRRWPLLLFAVAAIWLIGWAYLVIGGRTVTAEVVKPLGDGTCDVTWTSPSGQPRDANVECADDSAGSTKNIWELAPPFTGEAVDPAWTIGGVLVLALLAAVPAGAGMLADRRDRRRPVDETPAGNLSSQPLRDVLPALTEDDLIRTLDAPPVVLARYAPYAHRQVPADGWEHPRKPAGAGIPSLLRDLPRVLLWPTLGLGIVVMLTAPSPWRWWQLTTTDTAHATATSTGEIAVDGPAFVPEEVTVTYQDSTGATRRADVATTRELPEGAQLRITYSVAKPGWARIDGEGDGLPRYLLLTGAGALIALGIAGVRTSRLAIARRRVSDAAGKPGRPALATLTGAPDGEPVLLVCNPVAQPAEVLAVPLLTPLPHGSARAFPTDRALEVRAHGTFNDGEAVVVDVPGVNAALTPAGPAWAPDSDELLMLLDAEAAFIDAVDEDDEREGDKTSAGA